MAWDGTNETLYSNSNEDLGFDHPYEPWKNTTRQIKTVTASIRSIQQIYKKEYKRSLTTDDFAEALLKRGVLRSTITIQISSNQNYISIEFGTKQLMETFCTEPLEIGTFTITFTPATRKHQKPKLLNISFLNVPPETPEDILTEFLNEYADIKGSPFYPKKMYDGITYCTGTRVYQVSKLHQHLPRKLYNMFGRTVICIYNDQPNDYQRQRKPKYNPLETYSEYDTDTTQTDSDTQSENETQNQAETQNKPNNKLQKNLNKDGQNIHKNVTRRKQQQHANKSEFTIDKTPPENNEENYPTILNINTKQQQDQSKDQNQIEEPTIIPETQIHPQTQKSNSSPHIKTNDVQQPQQNEAATAKQNMTNTQIQSPSPTLVNNRFQVLQETPNPEDINTPDLNTDKSNHDINTSNTTTSTNETETEISTPTSPTPKTKRQIRLEARLYKAKKFTTQLQTTDFCDTGNLNNATKQEKNNIIALAMYNRLGTYDPSNEYIRNYKHKDILDKYKNISEKRPTKSDTLLELYDNLQSIDLRMEQLKYKNKNKCKT